MATPTNIDIESPKKLTGVKATGQRIPVGTTGDYKPCIARMPDGELLLVCFFPGQLEEGHNREEILLYRSSDDGFTWSRPENLTAGHDVIGREPYFSILKDGTMFLTVTILPKDVYNPYDFGASLLHRSDDAGRTWTTTTAHPQDSGKINGQVSTTRNVLPLPDGSLLFGLSDVGQDRSFMWRSTDGGKSWKQYKSKIEELDPTYPYPFLGEAVFWLGGNGTIYLFDRIDSHYAGRFKTEVPQDKFGRVDNMDRLIIYTSTDEGRTFTPHQAVGDIGEMYPALLRLADGQLLVTFTVRSNHDQLGVRAVLGQETQDDLLIDLEHDRFLLDPNTPPQVYSGGGFGNTVQVADGTLVTSYSWRDSEFLVHSEVLRWRLPDA